MTIIEHHAFRVTRNADLSVEEDEAGDLLAAVELELHRRRFGQAVRLEVAAGISARPAGHAGRRGRRARGQRLPRATSPSTSAACGPWATSTGPTCARRRGRRSTPPPLAGGADLFAVLDRARRPGPPPLRVVRRLGRGIRGRRRRRPRRAGHQADPLPDRRRQPVVAALIRASQAGKQVTAVVELQARFDEQANIAWARALEEAGVQVIYGLVALKTHSKISLVVRREGDRDPPLLPHRDRQLQLAHGPDLRGRRAVHRRPRHRRRRGRAVQPADRLGRAARPSAAWWSPRSRPGRTCSWPSIAEEAEAGRAGPDRPQDQRAHRPGGHRRPLPGLAGRVSGRPHRPRALLPPARVPGLSERIRVRSIVGRYLEHSRIFRFGGVDGRPLRMSIGSADLMERNLDRRVEVIVPIDDPAIQRPPGRHPRRRRSATRPTRGCSAATGAGRGCPAGPATAASVQPAGSPPNAGPRIPPAIDR